MAPRRRERPKRTVSTVALVEAPVGTTTPAEQVRFSSGLTSALAGFEDALGGRAAFVAALIASPDLPAPVQQVLTALGDPQYDHLHLGQLCVRFGLTPGDLFRAYRHATVSRAHVLALRQATEKLPAVMADLLDRSVSRSMPCPACGGSGTQPGARKPDGTEGGFERCSDCRGRGQQQREGDLAAQKLVLEVVEILKKSSGPLVQNLIAAPPSNPFGADPQQRGAFRQELEAALYDRGPRPVPTPTAPETAAVPVEAVLADV